MLADKLVKLIARDVAKEALPVLLPRAVVVPYLTVLLLASFVVQFIITEESVIE